MKTWVKGLVLRFNDRDAVGLDDTGELIVDLFKSRAPLVAFYFAAECYVEAVTQRKDFFNECGSLPLFVAFAFALSLVAPAFAEETANAPA